MVGMLSVSAVGMGSCRGPGMSRDITMSCNLGPIRTVRCSLVLRYCLGFSSKVCGQAEPSTSKSWPSAPLHRGWWLLARCLCSDTTRVLLVQKGFIHLCCHQGVRCREIWTLSLHPEVFLSVKWVSVLLHPKHLEAAV